MARRRPTVADLRAMKGKRQLTMLRVMTLEEAEAAEKAGVDIVSIPPELLLNPQYRDAAPSLFSMPGENFFEFGTADDFVRWAFQLYKASADAVYCAAGFRDRQAPGRRRHPGHRPCRPDPVPRDLDRRLQGRRQDRRHAPCRSSKPSRSYEAAGAFGAEIEVVPVEVAEAISKRTSLFMLSMGAGTGCDAQYLFAEDVLGTNRGHMPRHSKVYRNFAAEYDRLQAERVAAFSEFVADVNTKAYPEEQHIVRMDPAELKLFMDKADKHVA